MALQKMPQCAIARTMSGEKSRLHDAQKDLQIENHCCQQQQQQQQQSYTSCISRELTLRNNR
jgi:hypothetical protein